MKPSFYFRIGLFVLGAFAILVMSLFVFGAGQFLRPKLFCETYLGSSIQGIDIGSPVKFRGLTIGKVSNLEFTLNAYPQKGDGSAYNYIRVVMEIDRQVFPGMFKSNIGPILDESIHNGLRVRIEPLGVTGASYLNFDYVDRDRTPPIIISWKPIYKYIPSAPGELTGLLDSVNKIMRDIEDININSMGRNLVDLLENINRTFGQSQIQQLISDIHRLVVQMNRTIVDARLDKLSGQASNLIQDLDKNNQVLERVLKNLEPATRINSTELTGTLRDVRTSAENLRQLTQDLKVRPSLLLYGTPPSLKKKAGNRG